MDKEDKANVTRDHDLIVALNVKVDQILSFQADFVTRVAKSEQRLDAMDLYHAKIDLPRFMSDAIWVENFKANIKFISFAGGLSLATIGAVFERLLQIWFKF